MRYIMIMQVSAKGYAAGQDIDMAESLETMGRYNEELMAAGVFLSAEGLSDAAEGFRVDFDATPPEVTDGPYAEAVEVFNGYWLIEVASREEAEHWARKCPLGPGVALEVRRIHELADFAERGPDNKWIIKEQEWRAANS